VPYASCSGVGRRWRSPGPVLPWTGVREAAQWGPVAPQSPPTPGLSIPGDPLTSDEDCLNLNVWTPGIDDAQRPVLVWVHGGGFTTGTGASALFRGERLARRGDMVVVTINYRLGALGFLAHEALRDGLTSGCGNWGLLDQLAALEWVQDHIATFGGDPGNVTLFGESAGAMSICALLASDACGRSFHKAVLQSGPPVSAGIAWAEERAERLAQLAGSSTFGREQMLGLTSDTLVEATRRLASEAPHAEGLPLPLLPVVDGALLGRPPAEAVADGMAARVPLLVGTNRDEAALFITTDPAAQEIDIGRVIRRVARVTSPESAPRVVEAYRSARLERGEPVGERDLLTAIVGDYVFRLPSLAFAEAAHKHQPKTFVYLFTWESPFLGGIFGSSHGLDIPFVFGTVEDERIAPFAGSGPEASALSLAMQDAWVAFAHTGDPSSEAVGEWPAYDPLRRPTMQLGRVTALVEDPRSPERRAWDETEADFGVGHHHDV
ncbi:MAG: carboxylesterase/lipase family protein, partial [Acidimicrobiales bacterium]